MKHLISGGAAIILGATLLCSCGSGTGPAEKVLSKKVYTQVVSKYENVGDFEDGISIVSKGWHQDGAINTKGEEIIPAELYSLSELSEGLMVARNKDDKYGAYNKFGENVIAFLYDDLLDFSSGLSRFKKNGKYGYVNTEGKEVIPLSFSNANNFKEGLAAVRIKNGYGYINTKGELKSAAKYSSAEDFSEGYAVVGLDGKELALNIKCEEAFTFPKDFEVIGNCHNGLFLVFNKKTEKCGYIDVNGALVIPAEYLAADGFRDNKALAVTIQDEKLVYNFINKSGKVISALTEEEIDDYEEVEEYFSLLLWAVEKEFESGSHKKDSDYDFGDD